MNTECWYEMDEHHVNRSKINGESFVVLIDQDEYPSHIGNVAAISDEHILFLKRDMSELTHFRLEHMDVSDCRAIEYNKRDGLLPHRRGCRTDADRIRTNVLSGCKLR